MIKKPTKVVMAKIKEHMAKCFPQEGCGLVLKDGTWLPVDNAFDEDTRPDYKDAPVQSDPTSGFLVPIHLYLKHSKNIAVIVHSHIVESNWLSNGPSIADQRAQAASAVPWLVMVMDPAGAHKANYMYDEHAVSSSVYRPCLADQLSVVEKHYTLERKEREAGWDDSELAIDEYSRELVLGSGFSTEAVDYLEPGAVIFGGDDEQAAPTVVAVFGKDGKYTYRLKGQPETSSEEAPCKFIHRILARN